MESTEQNQLKQSKSISHYYSGHKYYNIQNEIIEKTSKYGSFSANNHKHYKNKLNLSKSTPNLYDLQNNNDNNNNIININNNNIPFSQYTPNPYYSVLPNHFISAMNITIDPNDFYINCKDDISSNDNDTTDDNINDNDSMNNSDIGVCLADSSSNTSLFCLANNNHHNHNSNCTSDPDESHSNNTITSTDIVNKIMHDNKESSHHPLLGMILVTISAVCYAALNLSVKALMYETPWQELMFIRMAITWLATLIWMLVQYKGKLQLCGPKHQRILLLLRAFFLWGAMFTCWWSFEFLPVGDGTTLAMSFPVWVSVFAHFVWKNDTGTAHNSSQRLDLFGWICVLAGLLGIAFVAQPEFIFGETAGNNTKHRNVGIIIGIASAICAGAQYVIVNYTKKDCHWLQVEQITAALSTFILCPLGAIAFALYYYRGKGNQFIIPWAHLNAARWAEEIALGLLGFCALALLTRGSQLDAPARTAICLYLEIPFVYVGQCIMTKSFPDVYIFVGIFLVLCSVIIPAIRKLRRAKKQKKLNERLKHRRRHMKGNKYGDNLRKYSDSSYDEQFDETVPLLQDAMMGHGGISGVTVDWSSEEESTGNTDIDDDDVYNGIDRAVL